jgi:hypothetical protein
MDFYIYVYLDPRKPGSFNYGKLEFDFEPIYVGKGHGERMYSHLKDSQLRNKNLKNNKINKILSEGYQPIIQKIYDNLTEQDVYKLEEEIVNKIGRLQKNEGPLVNMMNGGKGGLSEVFFTEEQLIRKSEAAKKAQSDPDYRNRRSIIAKNNFERDEVRKKHQDAVRKSLTREAIDKGKRWLLDEERKNQMIEKLKFHLAETKEERSQTQKESWSSEELLKKHSEIMKKINNDPEVKAKRRKSIIKKVFQYDMNKNLLKVWESVIDAAKELNISSSAISNNCRGITKKSNGFIWSYSEL